MKATCLWCDGPDALVELKETSAILYEEPKHHKLSRGDNKHGFFTKVSFDLTVDQAEAGLISIYDCLYRGFNLTQDIG